MGKKNKRSKKNKQRNKKNQLHQQGLEQLLKQGSQALASGKARKAVNCFKAALKKKEAAPKTIDTIKAGLVSAYCLREKELKEKNMLKEANVIRAMMIDYMPEASAMDEETLIHFLEVSDGPDGFKAYGQFRERHGENRRIERMLAEILVVSNQWDCLDSLSGPNAITIDSTLMKQAVSLMENAKWEEAYAVMKRLPRSSPFAPVKLFCRAMTAFYENNNTAVAKAVSMIAEDSVFAVLGRTLEIAPGKRQPKPKQGANPEKKHLVQKKRATVLSCLWHGPLYLFDSMDQLKKAVEKGQVNSTTGKIIGDVAAVLFPDMKSVAGQYIFEILFHPHVTSHKAKTQLLNLAKKTIGKRADLLKAKFKLFQGEDPIIEAGDYIRLIQKEFDDPEEQAIAKAMVIHHYAKILSQDQFGYSFSQFGDTKTKRLLGIDSDIRKVALLEMILHGVAIDPKNRALFDLALSVPAPDRETKNVMEEILETMCTAFPDEPQPLIELAWLYHGKNAFRKAQKALARAMVLAPHDSNVIDRHALSLIISADKNANCKRFHLVSPDIENVENLKLKSSTLLLLKAKKLIYKLGEKPQMPEKIIKIRLEAMPPYDRMRILTLVLMDIIERPWPEKKQIEKKIRSVFRDAVNRIGELTSPEIADMLMPLPKAWRFLFKKANLALMFLEDHRHVFNNIKDRDLIRLLDTLLYPIYYKPLCDMLSDRTLPPFANGYEPGSVIRFYEVFLVHLSGEDWNLDLFEEVIEEADADTVAVLKKNALRLASKAEGRLKYALETFDFGSIHDPFMLEGCYDDEDDDDDDDDFDFPGMPLMPGLDNFDLDDIFSDPTLMNSTIMVDLMNVILLDIEMKIDEMGLRGKPKGILMQKLKMMTDSNEFTVMKTIIQQLSKKNKLNALSKEAAAILL